MNRGSRTVAAWVTAVALALLALGAPLHALGHAQQAATGAGAERDPATAAQAHACEQCLQFAALEGGAAASPRALPFLATAASAPIALPAPATRSTTFQAYAARAPPAFG